MVQQVVLLLYFIREKFAVNGENVGQILYLVDVAMDILCLHGSFATLDVCKLVVRQIKADDGHCLFDVPLVLPQHFGICIGRWSFFGPIHNVSKIYGCQQYFDFEPPKIEVFFIEFVNDFSGLTLK